MNAEIQDAVTLARDAELYPVYAHHCPNAAGRRGAAMQEVVVFADDNRFEHGDRKCSFCKRDRVQICYSFFLKRWCCMSCFFRESDKVKL